MRLNLGLDLDGVVADWNRGFHETFWRQLDMPEALSFEALDLLADQENITSWDFPRDVVGEKNWEWFWSTAVPMHRVFARLPYYQGAIDEARDLIEAHNVYVVTTRPESVRNETYGWIGFHHLRPKAIVHVDHKVNRSFGGGQDKVLLINALGLDAMLEDNADTAQDIAIRTSAMSFLLDRPWNRRSKTECHRVASIAEYQMLVEKGLS